ncbi:hypothetical protein B0H11DRAFT_2228163 [Mycena galericulata]|nr:hypothetical protein B0H11DRAFT_2228163 [Mycena galericulata]
MDPLTECREDLEDWDPEHDPLLCTAPYHPECFLIRESEVGRAAGEVFAEALSHQERCRARLFVGLLERDLQVLMQACEGRRNALLRIATAVEKEHRVLSAIGRQHLPPPAERFPMQEALLYTDSILNRTHHLAISIPRILHKIERLTAKLNAYRYPVLTLPTEIVSTIFCLSETSPSALSQICSSWRVIAHQTHKLWTSVRIKLTSSGGSADILDAWMQRSGTLGLDIVLREQTANPVEKAAVMAIVQRHWARVRSFDVVCTSSTLGYLSGKAECLLSVNITLVDYPVQSQVTLWDLERNAPHLQILVSKTLYYKTLSFPYRSVTHVISERDPCSLDSNELLVLLRCFVVIEHASFRLKETESDTVLTALPAGFQPIILDRLDTLEDASPFLALLTRSESQTARSA